MPYALRDTDLGDSEAIMSKNKKRTKKYLWLRILAGLIIICAFIIADSAYRLTVTRYELGYADLPETFDGFRIVQLSDLHGMEFGRDNERLIRAVKKAEPDLIAMTGDYIESAGDLPATESLLKGIREIAPIYFVGGNHDWASGDMDKLRGLLVKYGVIYMENDYELYEKDGGSILICGAADPNSWADMETPEELAEEAAAEYPDRFTLFIAHRNNWPDIYPKLDVDLIICGHGHGGVVRLPIVGGLLGTEHNLFPKYDDGVFKSGRYNMVVSRGIGGNGAIKIPRFLNNPEIVVTELKKLS